MTALSHYCYLRVTRSVALAVAVWFSNTAGLQSAQRLIVSTNGALNTEIDQVINRFTLLSDASPHGMIKNEAAAIVSEWRDRDDYSKAILFGNLSFYFNMRYDLGFQREALSTGLAWKAIENSAAIPPSVETSILGLLHSTAYQRRFGSTERDPEECRKVLTARWLDCLARLESAAIATEMSAAGLTASINLHVPGGAAFSGTDPAYIFNPTIRAEYEQAIAENDRRSKLISAASTARNLSDTATGSAAHFLGGVHNYSGTPERIKEVVQLSESSIKDEKLRRQVLERLQGKLPENMRNHLASARKFREQELAAEQEREESPKQGKRLAARAKAGVQTPNPSVNDLAQANREGADLKPDTASPATIATTSASARNLLLWLALAGSAMIIVLVLWRAQARTHSSRPK